MDTKAVSDARGIMEDLLRGLPLAGDKYPTRQLAADDPRIINKGTSSLVLELGATSLVGKIIGYKSSPFMPGFYALQGVCAGSGPHVIERTAQALRELGLENVPFYQEFRSGLPPGQYPGFYHLTADLRGSGHYAIYEVDRFPFEAVPNGAALRCTIESSCRTVLAAVENGLFTLEVDHHISHKDPAVALRRMFFGRIDARTGLADLVVGDLDHFSLYKP